MGLMARMRRLFRDSSKEPGGTTLVNTWNLGPPMLRRGTPELFKAYATSPYFRMVNARLAHERATAVRKCRVLFDGPDDDPQRQQIMRDDPRYEVIRALRRPVRMSSGHVVTLYMREKIKALWFGLAGESYEGKLRDPRTNAVVGLVPISPLWVLSVPSSNDPNYTVQVDAHSSPKKIPASEIIPYVDPLAENPYGRGCGAGNSLAQEIDTDDGIARMSRAIIQNQGTPQGLLVIEGAKPSDLDVYRAKWREKFGGPDRAGQVEFVGGKAQFFPLQQARLFAESLEARKAIRDEFCHVHGISPEVFGILDGSTRDSSWVANTNMAAGALVPWMEIVTDAEQAHLVPEFVANPEDACLGYTSPVPDDRDLMVRVMATAPSAFRGRDARKVGGFAPDKDLDNITLGSEPQRATETQLPIPAPISNARLLAREPEFVKALVRNPEFVRALDTVSAEPVESDS